MKAVMYLGSEKDLNDATVKYIGVVLGALSISDYEVSIQYNFQNFDKVDLVVTIDAKSFLINRIVNWKRKLLTVNWFQGVVAEEALLTKNSILRKIFWSFLERATLRLSDLNLFVSREMLVFFKSRANYSGSNYFVMPCFNRSQVDNRGFDSVKYSNQSFVYAGSLDSWQCIDQTFDLFLLIKKSMPEARLTVLTKDCVSAKEMLSKRGIEEATVKYVPLADLDLELQKHRYGFVIRGDILVNNVATPTKLSSYLANGVIPIYTDAISSFIDHPFLDKFSIRLNANDPASWADNILNFMRSPIDADQVRNAYENFFKARFNEDEYMNKLASLIRLMKKK